MAPLIYTAAAEACARRRPRRCRRRCATYRVRRRCRCRVGWIRCSSPPPCALHSRAQTSSLADGCVPPSRLALTQCHTVGATSCVPPALRSHNAIGATSCVCWTGSPAGPHPQARACRRPVWLFGDWPPFASAKRAGAAAAARHCAIAAQRSWRGRGRRRRRQRWNGGACPHCLHCPNAFPPPLHPLSASRTATLHNSCPHPPPPRFPPCGTQIVYPAGRCAVITDITSGAQRAFEGHTRLVTAIALHPSSRFVASAQVCAAGLDWTRAHLPPPNDEPVSPPMSSSAPPNDAPSPPLSI